MMLIMVEEDLVCLIVVSRRIDKYFLDNNLRREEQTSPYTWREFHRYTMNQMGFYSWAIFVLKYWWRNPFDWNYSFDQTCLGWRRRESFFCFNHWWMTDMASLKCHLSLSLSLSLARARIFLSSERRKRRKNTRARAFSIPAFDLIRIKHQRICRDAISHSHRHANTYWLDCQEVNPTVRLIDFPLGFLSVSETPMLSTCSVRRLFFFNISIKRIY